MIAASADLHLSTGPTARRVFFSFDYDRDLWRATHVRNSHVVTEPDVAGFFDRSEYEDAKRAGAKAIRSLILKHLAGTIVTVVLIGLRTALSPWVQYEIQQSTARKNGLLGIYIHHLKDRLGFTTSRGGPTPLLPPGVEFPTYDWDDDLDRFRSAIEAAGRRADALRG